MNAGKYNFDVPIKYHSEQALSEKLGELCEFANMFLNEDGWEIRCRLIFSGLIEGEFDIYPEYSDEEVTWTTDGFTGEFVGYRPLSGTRIWVTELVNLGPLPYICGMINAKTARSNAVWWIDENETGRIIVRVFSEEDQGGD